LLKFQAKEEVANQISLKASLSRGFLSDSENARLSEPPFYHNIFLFMRVVEFFRKIKRAPLATVATKTPYMIYLENRSKISKADRKRRLRRNT
jgi:hypothetical protein